MSCIDRVLAMNRSVTWILFGTLLSSAAATYSQPTVNATPAWQHDTKG